LYPNRSLEREAQAGRSGLSGGFQLSISVNHRFDKRANFGKVKFPNRPNQRGPDQ
jgi:hypothetical protein